MLPSAMSGHVIPYGPCAQSSVCLFAHIQRLAARNRKSASTLSMVGVPTPAMSRIASIESVSA
jgi:hypothetical protein